MSGATSDVLEEHLVDESSQYMLDDLQLAAELGKTLLERNKELEASLKHHQISIDDHVQEIEYLTKQNAALREVNDSRMKIYEQLEVSIQDLERDKYKLALEYQAEKKHVKQLCCNIEYLETKVEELTRSLEEAHRQTEAERRSKQTERLIGQQQQHQSPALTFTLLSHASKDAKSNATPGGGEPAPEGGSPSSRQATEPCKKLNAVSPSKAKTHSSANCAEAACPAPRHDDDTSDGLGDTESARGVALDELHLSEENEEMLRMMQELQQTQRCLLSEQGKVGELEEQLAAIAQENQLLQSKLLQVNTTGEMKSVHDELSILDEFRQGQVCTRCLRGFDDQPDTDSIITGTEDDDQSLIDLINSTEVPKMYCSSVTLEIAPTKPASLDLSLSDCAGSTNPYRELVEKYEALLEVHRQPLVRKGTMCATGATATGTGNNTPVDSCQPQQLLPAAGDGHQPQPRYLIEFSAPAGAPQGGGGCPGKATDGKAAGVAVGGSEYSETETASSGYSDEVSNKATQTDESPKNFLCTIADGKDWRFSIYEDPSAIDSRFRFSPSHRELFREIFSVLKKAAENRDEGDQLPLLDDTKPLAGVAPGVGEVGTGVGAMARPGAISVPPVTPANDEPPSGFGEAADGGDGAGDEDDDTVSFVSSSAVSEQSFAMSECITKSERRRIARQAKSAAAASCRYAGEEENRPPVTGGTLGQQQHHQDGRIQAPYTPQPLEYLSVSVGLSKRKSRRRSHRREPSREAGTPAGETPQPGGPTPPRLISGGRKHRPSFRPWIPEADGASTTATTPAHPVEWNGNTMTIYNRSRGSQRSADCPPPPIPLSSGEKTRHAGKSTSGRQQQQQSQCPPFGGDLSSVAAAAAATVAAPSSLNRYAELASSLVAGDDVVEFKPSSASQHLHKLQKLDLSYAEVLRRADTCQPYNTRRQQARQQQ